MEQIIEVDVAALAFIAGSLVPLVTALVTRFNSSSRLKSITSLVLSLVSGGVVHLTAHDGRSTWQSLAAALIATYLASGVTYQNLWKPTGLAPTLGSAVPGVIGKELAVEDVPFTPTEADITEIALNAQASHAGPAVTLEAVSAATPDPATAVKVTVLKGRPVYADDGGFLFVSK